MSANEPTRTPLPGMPFEYIIRRDAQGKVRDETLIVKGLGEAYFIANVEKWRKWFMEQPPLQPEPVAPPGTIPDECPNCGNSDPGEWWVNLDDRRPNVKCKQCNYKHYLKAKDGEGRKAKAK